MRLSINDFKKEIIRQKVYILASLIPIMFIVGILSGASIKRNNECQNKFNFINSVFNCGHKYIIEKSSTVILEQKLNTFIESKKQTGEASQVSIYFRDLQAGPVFGINEDELFISASLLKLPIALTFFKLDEESRGIMQKNLKLVDDTKSDKIFEQFYKSKKSVRPGVIYTVEDLINSSLIYSDNLANNALKNYLNKIEPKRDLILQTYHDLGLVIPESIEVADISNRNYAAIFRILYNASFLTTEDSEKVLSILSNSDYNTGIAAGIPKNIILANKFGERFIGEEKQLHDCGIIYYPGNPYVLCIMSRGDDFKELEKVISEISKLVYEEIDSRRID